MRYFNKKILSAAAFLSVLTACGGGSESTSGATAGPSAPAVQKDAATLAKSAVDAANSSAQFASASASFAASPLDDRTKSIESKAINQSINCASNSQFSSYCAGLFAVESNISALGGQTGVPAGTYLNISFNAFRLLTQPVSEAMTGTVAMVFVDAFNSPTLLNGSATIKLDITAPKPEVHTNLRLTFNQLSAQTSSNGVTLNGGASVTEAGQPSVVMLFRSWRTLGTTPQAGSSVTVTNGAEVSTIQVVSASATQVTFDVSVSVNGVAQPTKRVVMDIVNGLPVYRVI
jgi:hypothetical protein